MSLLSPCIFLKRPHSSDDENRTSDACVDVDDNDDDDDVDDDDDDDDDDELQPHRPNL